MKIVYFFCENDERLHQVTYSPTTSIEKITKDLSLAYQCNIQIVKCEYY